MGVSFGLPDGRLGACLCWLVVLATAPIHDHDSAGLLMDGAGWMMIGQLPCGGFAPGCGRVVAVRSLRSWLPTRESPLEPLAGPEGSSPRPPGPEGLLFCPRALAAGPASERLRRRATGGKPPGPCLLRRGLQTRRQPTAKPLARARTQAAEEGLRAGGYKRPLEKKFFLRPSPAPATASAGSELYHRVFNEPFDAVMVSVVVPALGMRDVHLRARLKIWTIPGRPDQHGLR